MTVQFKPECPPHTHTHTNPCLLPQPHTFVWKQHCNVASCAAADNLKSICPLGKQTSLFLTEHRLDTSPSFPLTDMVTGSRCCPVILCLALTAGLGSVLGLGEDLDRPLFGPPGSPIPLRESDMGLKKALEFAEERYNRGSNSMHLRKVSRFISATKQVT